MRAWGMPDPCPGGRAWHNVENTVTDPLKEPIYNV